MVSFILSVFISAYGIIYPAELIGVVDGDTYIMQVRLSPQNIFYIGSVRLDGVDTPESTWRAKCVKEQRLGKKATQFAKKWFTKHGRYVKVLSSKREKYGRMMGKIETYAGVSLGDDLIKAGLAIKYDGGKKHGWCNS
jgi:endonuclease YncB( thermonuclease family)